MYKTFLKNWLILTKTSWGGVSPEIESFKVLPSLMILSQYFHEVIQLNVLIQSHSVNCTRYSIHDRVHDFLLFRYTNLNDARFFEIYTKNTRNTWNYTIINRVNVAIERRNWIEWIVQKIILDILAIPASSGEVERLFFQDNIRFANRRNHMSSKNVQLLVYNEQIEIQTFEDIFLYFKKNARLYTKIHDFLKYTNTCNCFCKYTKYTIHEEVDTRQFTGPISFSLPGLTLPLASWLSWQDLAKFLLHLGNHGSYGKIRIKILLR